MSLVPINIQCFVFSPSKKFLLLLVPHTTRKILNTGGQNLPLKCKYSVIKHARDGFDAVGSFLVSGLLETDKIYL
jgi:hypothetical protein